MSLGNMGLEMSLGKDERKFRMQQQIRNGETLTVKSCAQSLGLSRSTILTYLKEVNMSIYDDEKKEMTRKYNDDTEVVMPF